MRQGPAHYLLRCDDLCPMVSAQRWRELVALITEFGLKPILAVVPDNGDYALQASAPDPAFWATIRGLEKQGCVIALHGYRHLCNSTGKSLLGLHRRTEFAGVPEETQHAWIRAGLEILRGHGLNPRVWVAPRHGFDKATLRALHKEGIGILSDGFARVPFQRGRLVWIPQQLWGPVLQPRGLWTICLHPNTLSDREMMRLREFVRAHSEHFTSVDRVLAEWKPGRLSFPERLRELLALWCKRTSHARRRHRRKA